MAILKCRMCGGDVTVTEEMTVVDCQRCGARQTVPAVNSGKKVILFSRASRLLRACDFDRAADAFRSMAEEFPTEPEAWWGLVLCRYGVSYIDGPGGKRVPACHRTSLASVLDDSDYEQALENADPSARRVYREEARAIENARVETVARSKEEIPCDVFICHQEGAVEGRLAREAYDALTGEGCRVFICPKALDEKTSAEYEPAIFSALNSARVMLVFGTDCERFNGIWVKNAWNRFLELAETGEHKTLIPCYQDMSAADLPREFAGMDSRNMASPGAMESVLLRTIELLSTSPETPPVQTVAGDAAAAGHVGQGAQYFLSDRQSVRRIASLIAAGANHTAAVRSDGKVIAGGYTGDGQCSVAAWRDAVAVAADVGHTVALKSDGTVVAAGKNDFGQCNVAPWSDIVAIAAGASYTIGLRSDGTVVAAGKNDQGQCNVTGWTDIVAIAADAYRTIGVKSDGTVLVAGWAASLYKSKAVAWRDIVDVSSSTYHTVGLREDGTVVAIGSNGIPDWRDIAAVSTGPQHTVGLKTDGTVVAVGDNKFGQCGVSDWKNIVAVAAGAYHTVGLKVDGTLVAVGDNRSGQCEVADWKLFSDLGALEEKISAAEVCRQEKAVLVAEQTALEKELSRLKGLFTGKRRKEIEERLEVLEREISELEERWKAYQAHV